ncbi:MAG: PhoH family protein [Planctomycetes bacterium]|nr:PhoH family protein [Planctomycetota bacterium]
MVDEIQHTLSFDNVREEMAFLGSNDRHLKRLREAFGVQVSARDGLLRMRGMPQRVQQASSAVEEMLQHYRRSHALLLEDVERCIQSARHPPFDLASAARGGGPPRPFEARTRGQERYLRAMEQNEVVFCIGPAGTGKTYLAVAMAIQLLRSASVKKIVLVRPAVEAGEKLGFLPGDLQEKVDPFLRPLYDALHEMLDFGQFKRYMERDIIEVVPLAYMRGRTLNHAFAILDEAQNCTAKQMKMFLTRLGQGSRAVITGDITQIDLPEGERSGLLMVETILQNIRGLCFVYLNEKDVVRHRIVQDIVLAYEKFEGDPSLIQGPATDRREKRRAQRTLAGRRKPAPPAAEFPPDIGVEDSSGGEVAPPV